MTCVTPICLGARAMLPLVGFAHSHCSLAWSLTVAGLLERMSMKHDSSEAARRGPSPMSHVQ